MRGGISGGRRKRGWGSGRKLLSCRHPSKSKIDDDSTSLLSYLERINHDEVTIIISVSSNRRCALHQ
jgi:hypothetical protein